MKTFALTLLVLVAPVVAQETNLASMTLSQVEATIEQEAHRIAVAPETDALIQAHAQSLIHYRNILAENPEIQAIEVEKAKAEEILGKLILDREAKEKELQKSDSIIKAAKETLDLARGAVEAVYQTPTMQAFEARRIQLITDAAVAKQKE